MKTVLYVALGLGMLGFAGLASAHGLEGEGKASGKFGFGIFNKGCAHSEEISEFETFVGLSVAEIREQKKDGKTMGEILEDQGKDRGETEAFLEARAETKIEAAVERKDLNDEQEDNLRDRIYNFIQKLLDRWFGN